MKQYQDERTLQVRNRIYAELMRIMLCVVVLSFCHKGHCISTWDLRSA